MTRKEIFNPIGPLGSIFIGIVLMVLAYLRIVNLGWVGLAFLLGGFIMLVVRIINANKTPFDKT